MKIDFYYWGSMCPISNEIIARLGKHKGEFDIHLHDFTHDPSVAKRERIFFPFMTVIDGVHRFYKPISDKFINTLLAGGMPEETPYLPQLSARERTCTIEPISSANYSVASRCTGRECCEKRECKPLMYSSVPNGIMGFMNTENGILLGGAEYYPSVSVPYDVPKGNDTAFITCVYMSGGQYDYKSAPLRALEQHLAQTYKKVIVISDEAGVFPNGDMAFFLRNGYSDKGVIFADDYCKLHLLSKEL